MYPPPPPGPPGWGPQQPWYPPGYPQQVPQPPPQQRPPVPLIIVAIVVTAALCCLSGALKGRRSDPQPSAAPEPPAESVAPSESFVDDPEAGRRVMAYFRDFCVEGRRRRDPPQCPDWETMVVSVSVSRGTSGRYRAEVSTVIPSRDALWRDLATTICSQTAAGLPGGMIANMNGAVRVKMLDGNTIAHNAFGRCTAGLF